MDLEDEMHDDEENSRNCRHTTLGNSKEFCFSSLLLLLLRLYCRCCFCCASVVIGHGSRIALGEGAVIVIGVILPQSPKPTHNPRRLVVGVGVDGVCSC